MAFGLGLGGVLLVYASLLCMFTACKRLGGVRLAYTYGIYSRVTTQRR